MVTLSGHYLGQLRCAIRHDPSGTVLHTSAPVDNGGQGETFSPTDLVAVSLLSCAATVMGLYARKHKVSLDSMALSVAKTMSADLPRRITCLELVFNMPAGLDDPVIRKGLEQAVESCPVKHTLAPGVLVKASFSWA